MAVGIIWDKTKYDNYENNYGCGNIYFQILYYG